MISIQGESPAPKTLQAAGARRAALLPSTSTKPPQILTVDDDPAICKLIERAFKDAGYRTQTAHSAVEMRRKIGDAAMVLLDINLPGANGIDLSREIR